MKKLIVALIALAGFGSLYAEPASASSYIQTGLISQYDAIDNAGTGQHSDSPSVWKDLVGNRDLTFEGSPTFGADKVSINAEDQYFKNTECADFVNAIGNGAFTLEMHYTATTTSSPGTGGRTLFTIGILNSWSTRYLGFVAFSDNLYNAFMFRDSKHVVTSGLVVGAGKQHTVSIVVNGNTAYVYQDGVLKYQQNAGSTGAGNNTFTIGHFNSSSLNRFTLLGDYRSVRVYNTALTAEQIASNVAVDRQRFVYANYTYRSITIDNAAALAKKTTTSAKLSFGADALARAAGAKDQLYIAYGSSNYRGDDIARYDHVQYVADVAVETTEGTYQIPEGFGTDYTRFRFFFKTPIKTPSSSAYAASTSLLSQYDAIDNDGKGQHSASPTVWKDLVGGRDLTFRGSPSFGENAVSINAEEQYFYNTACNDFVDAINGGAFTLEMHYTPTDKKNGRQPFSIGSSYSTQQRFFMIYTYNNFYDGLMFRRRGWEGYSNTGWDINVGTQHTLTIVVNGNTAYYYRDGILEQTQVSANDTAANNTFTVGFDKNHVSGRYTQLMDVRSVRAYSKALTQEEILANKNVDDLRYGAQEGAGNFINFSSVVVSDESTATWMYDATTKVLTTDSGWEFNTDGNANGLTLTSLKTVGTGGTLDFSGVPSAGTPTIVAFSKDLIYNKDGNKLTKLILPDTITSIGENAFRQCTRLSDVSFQNLPTFGNNAFADTKAAPYGRYTYPADNASWVSLVNSLKPTTWAKASQAYTNAYNAAFTDELVPTGYATYGGRAKWLVPVTVEVKETRLGILGTPVECGEVSPGYGDYGVVETRPVTCTAPAFADYQDALYECQGYKLGKLEGSEIVYGELVSSLSCDFDPDEVGSYYVQWQWTKVAYPVAITAGTGVNISIDEQPYKDNTGYYEAGQSITVRATGPNGELPVRWYVDGVGGHDNEATISVTVPSKKMDVQVYIALDWTYANNTLTDGYWTFAASGDASAITIGALTARTTLVDILDFRKTVHAGEATGVLVSMANDSCNKTPASTVRDVYFCSTVTNIGANAFRGRDKLNTVVLSPNLKSIGNDAFRDCSVRTVTPFLPEDITLGYTAFHNAYNLTGDLVIKTKNELVLPYEGGDKGLFQGTKITSADLSQSKVTVVGKNCFRGCSQLGDVSFPKALTNIGSAVFYDSLNKLTNVVFRSYPKSGFNGDLFGNEENSYKRRIVYPAGNADWKKFIDDRRASSKFVTWESATVGQKADYTSSFGSKPLPECSLIFLEQSSYSKARFWMVPQTEGSFLFLIR